MEFTNNVAYAVLLLQASVSMKKEKVLTSSVLMTSAIHISEYLHQGGLNFAPHIQPSSGSGRPMGCSLKNTHGLRNPPVYTS